MYESEQAVSSFFLRKMFKLYFVDCWTFTARNQFLSCCLGEEIHPATARDLFLDALSHPEITLDFPQLGLGATSIDSVTHRMGFERNIEHRMCLFSASPPLQSIGKQRSPFPLQCKLSADSFPRELYLFTPVTCGRSV